MTRQALLAAAENAAGAASDMIECAREGVISPYGNVGAGDTLTLLADAARLLIDAMDTTDPDATHLHGALVRFLEDRT